MIFKSEILRELYRQVNSAKMGYPFETEETSELFDNFLTMYTVGNDEVFPLVLVDLIDKYQERAFAVGYAIAEKMLTEIL